MGRWQYDLAVIGAGSAGLVAATTAAQLGASVLLIERDRVGGDCTWTGCVPSKALIHAAAAAHHARRAGWLSGAEVDFGAVMAGVHAAVERVYAGESPAQLERLGITVRIAEAEFADPSSLRVGGEIVRARRYLVATGADPWEPEVPGLAAIPHLNHLNVFELSRLPRSLLVLGGGPVGCELAQAFGRLGSRVTILDQASRLLEIADPEASALVGEVFQREGIELRLGTAVSAFQTTPSGIAARCGESLIEASTLLVATGRRARTTGLGLDAAGIAVGALGIEVDSRLRTTNPIVYAAGDVAGSLQFTHYAAWQGARAIRNALFPGSASGIRSGLPWAVFTDPVVAQVGTTTTMPGIQAHRLGGDRVDRAQAEDRTAGYLKLYSRAGRVVGGSAVGAAGGELVNELSVAIDAGLKMSQLAGSIHVYPTYGFAIQQLAAQAELERYSGGWRRRLVSEILRSGK